ncbi:MAG TPA: MarR family transcriptional regulator [Thermomicrobiales bacterium]|jgi:DNA-binding MarR family transcriptional regulator|nr:MarR family transcriptional regulator [Thermomicrobiales bacterium]
MPTTSTPTQPAAAARDAALVAALDAVMPRYLRVLRHALTAAEGDDRLTLSQLRCLQLMADADGPALTTRLARALLVTPPTMTRTIDALVERGLVARHPDPANRRQIGLVLTAAGRAALARYEQVLHDRLRDLLAHLDEAAKERLLAATGDLAAMLDADERAAEERACR